MSDIAENLAVVRENIAEAAAKSGRSAQDITLVAVSKFVPTGYIQKAVQAGQTLFGENRAQEMRDKMPLFPQCRWHYIGQLQSNKLKYCVGKASLIQSVDGEQMLTRIQQMAQARGCVQDVLIQVNLAGEAQKAGLAKEGLFPLLANSCGMEGLRVRGLMLIPPVGTVAQSRRWFAQGRALYDAARQEGWALDTLSMGMSQDYVAAIEEGSTMVRVGTGIFGARSEG